MVVGISKTGVENENVVEGPTVDAKDDCCAVVWVEVEDAIELVNDDL